MIFSFRFFLFILLNKVMFHPLIRVSIRLKVQINVVDAKKICTKIKLDEK